MGLTKREYKDHMTCITAQNLNDIQDAIIDLEKTAQGGGLKHLVSLSEVGLSGVVTMAQVLEALPSYSELILTSNTNLENRISDVPGATGLLVVTKSSVYAAATWTQVNTTRPAVYTGSWHSTGGWSGWITDLTTATVVDFSDWPAFTLTVNGMPQEGAAELDDAGRPTAITLNGHTLTLTLPEVE